MYQPLQRIILLAVLWPCTALAGIVPDGIAPQPVVPSYVAAQYAAFQTAAAQYETIIAQGGWPELSKGETIRPGMEDARVPQLREILSIMGDYNAAAFEPENPLLYDDILLSSVKAFQHRHGLEEDGLAGGNTQAALRVTPTQRLVQIKRNEERALKLLQHYPTQGQSVLVNIPSATVLMLENGNLKGSMRTIIGRPDRATPLMQSEITYVHFNPAWHVPTSIASKDLLPKIRKDPNFLLKGGYTVTVDGEAIDPDMLDLDEMAANPGQYHLRQAPGDDNALGRIKFSFPNSQAIYLHSTSHPKLFAKTNRALSSGCVRLQDPRAFAQFALAYNALAVEKVDAYYDSHTPRSIAIKHPIRLDLIYWTALADVDTGQLYFYPDVYGMDK